MHGQNHIKLIKRFVSNLKTYQLATLLARPVRVRIS